MKREHETWYLVGTVERGRSHKTIGYQRYDGYSTDPNGHTQPWCTYREAQAMSRAGGKVARFKRPSCD